MIEFGSFEGAYCDSSYPGHHVIEKNGVDVVKVARLEVIDKVLHCDFEVLDPVLNNENVTDLVFIILLKDFCKNYYLDKARFVRLNNKETNESWQLPNIY